MSSGALRAAWEAAQAPTPQSGTDLRAAWDAAQGTHANEPGPVSRGLSGLVASAAHAIMHPIDTAESIITAPIKSAYDAVVSPGVGEARPDPRLSKGGNPTGAPIDRAPYDAEHGGITPDQRRNAALQTLANVASPAAAGAVSSVLGKVLPSVLAKGAGLATAGAGEGAAYNPSDPAAGAIAGGIAAPILGAGVSAVGTVAPVVETAIQAKNATEPTESLVALNKARVDVSRPLYKDFRDLGDLGRTAKLDDLLGTANQPGLPVITRAVETVKGESPILAKLPDTDAKVLDAVYKRVGNKAWAATHGFETGEARSALLDAIDEAAQAKGGSYSDPVAASREGFQAMGGVQQGRDALTNALSPSGGGIPAALEKSPAALEQRFPNLSPEVQQKVMEGLYGQVGRKGLVSMKKIAGTPIVPVPSAALLEGTKIAGRLRPSQVNLDDLLNMLGLPAGVGVSPLNR